MHYCQTALCCAADDSALQRRRHRQDALKSYYSLADDPSQPSVSEHAAGTSVAGSCDINGPSFEPDVYLGRLIKERSLTELMDKEAEMVQNIRSLDSDMQTLVYENYNKFISATDTIRTVCYSRLCGLTGNASKLPFPHSFAA